MHVTTKKPNGKYFLMPTVIKPKFASTSTALYQSEHLVILPMQRNVILSWCNSKPFKKRKVFQNQTNTKLVTLSHWINLLSALMDNCSQIMDEKVITMRFMVELSSMIQKLVLSVLKIKSPLVLAKLSWLRLKNALGIQLVLRSTFIKNVCLLLMSLKQKHEHQSFSWVGAHHQNAHVECVRISLALLGDHR